MASNKKPAVKVLRPKEGEPPKIRVCSKQAVNNREKGVSSSMKTYFDYSKANAEYDPMPKERHIDRRGAANEAAARRTVMAHVMNPTKEPYTEPQPAARVPTNESRANLERGRGSLHVYGGPANVRHAPSPLEVPPPVRCQTASAVENMERSRSGVMGRVIVHSADFREPSRPLRGDDKASENADRARGSVMAAMLDHRQARPEPQPQPRCPSPQALEQRERARGVMDRLMTGQLPGDPCPKQRLGHGAGPNASREGSGMAQNFGQYGRQTAEAAPAPRVRPEAQGYAAKNNGTLTQQQYNYRTGPGPADEPAPNPRCRPGAGTDNMNASRGVVTKNLLGMYGKLPGDSRSHARVQPRGRKIARLSSGTQMSNLLSPPKPRRVRRRPRSCHT